MDSSQPGAHTPTASPPENPTWTYPTRTCRICFEEVPATVTMYPPGLPLRFQKPIVEYKNDDEYGRLIKPCMCRGSLRYIHELCLIRSRTEVNRSGSMWKCHECGHQFNFQKLTVQRVLSSKIAVGALTVLFMAFVVFILGFVADPIINIYLDPYDSLMGNESVWEELEVRSVREGPVSIWTQHFAKGFISLGLVGFLKTLFLNPFQWVNLRFGGTFSSTARGTTGRDRAVNISWIAIIIGVCSAFAFFYRWVAAIVRRSLQRLGNNIVDTQLPGDDDDLKPPSGWQPSGTEESKIRTDPMPPTNATTSTSEEKSQQERSAEAPSNQDSEIESANNTQSRKSAGEENQDDPSQAKGQPEPAPLMSGSWVAIDEDPTSHDAGGISGVHRQGWSFSNL